MTAALFPSPTPEIRPVIDDEPVALLQLCVTGHERAVANATSAVYREVRRGRRVVAVASGAPDAADQLVQALEAIGVEAAIPRNCEALLTGDVSVVAGPERTCPQPRPTPERVLRVALAGRGVVGGGLLPRLLADPRFELVGVLVRDLARIRDVEVPRPLLLTDPAALLAREPDVLIEVTSDPSVGLALTRAALVRGMHVISASKQALIADLEGLQALARAHGAQLLYSAAVGGGAALIETVRRARAHGDIVLIEGVLNGTCNFILNRVAEGYDVSDALSQAQRAGFAEADSSADLDGRDAMAKLNILANAAGHVGFDRNRVSRSPLEAVLIPPTGTARQVARFDAGSRVATVGIESVTADPLLSDLADEWNAARVVTVDGKLFTARGRGAGREPTVESVWADLVDLLDARSTVARYDAGSSPT